MNNYLIGIEYNGARFRGWQRQPDARTVQGELETVLSAICDEPIRLSGVSRTDAGVHAYGQRASFRGNFSIPPDRLMLAANHRLGGGRGAGRAGDIRITACEAVPETFHARFGAVGKKYVYKFLSVPRPDPFLRDFFWQIEADLDTAAMRAAARELIGTRDFAAFRSAGGAAGVTTVRTITGISLCRRRANAGIVTEMEITGDGFLYNMVRIIAGSLFAVSGGRLTRDDLRAALACGDRALAGPTAPPQGLYLAEVYYDRAAMLAAARRRFERAVT